MRLRHSNAAASQQQQQQPTPTAMSRKGTLDDEEAAAESAAVTLRMLLIGNADNEEAMLNEMVRSCPPLFDDRLKEALKRAASKL